jgi:hypothetical protein
MHIKGESCLNKHSHDMAFIIFSCLLNVSLTLEKFVLTFQGVVAGLLVQNTLKFLLGFGQVSPYLVSAALVFKQHLFSFSLSIANYSFTYCLKIEYRIAL